MTVTRAPDGGLKSTDAAFRRAIEADPSLAEGYRRLGESLLRQGREREAGRTIRDRLPRLGDDPAALRPLEEFLSRDDSIRPQSPPVYRAILRGSPDHAALRLEFARNLGWSGHHREALEECRWLQSQKGTKRSIRFEARLLEAQVLSWSRRTREAEERYRAILADGPSADAHAALADMARWEGHYAEAEACYRDALAVDANNPQALQGLQENRPEGGPQRDPSGDSARHGRRRVRLPPPSPVPQDPTRRPPPAASS